MAGNIKIVTDALDEIIERLGRLQAMPVPPETRILIDITRDRAKMLKELLAKVAE